MSKKLTHMFRKLFTIPNALLIFILLVAAFLRLYMIDGYMTFLGDEGRDVLVVWNILHGHPTLLGPTASVGGFFLGPIYYYFMTPFLWAWNYNPVGPAIMVALFGIATVWFVVKVGEEFFDSRAGLIAGILYAISPLVIAYSRSSWNPNLMPFFSLLTLYFVYKGIKNNSIKQYLFSGISLGIALQLHYLTTFLGGIIVVYLLSIFFYNKIFVKKGETMNLASLFKASIGIFIGFLVGFSPFLLFEVRHGFENSKNVINFILHSKDTGAGGNFLGIIQNVFFRIFGRLVTDYPPPEQVSLQGHVNITIWYTLTLLLAIGSVGFLLFKLVENKEKREKYLQYLLLSIWFFVGVLLFGFYKKQIYDYYFTLLFPLPFFLVGGLLSYFLSKQLFFKVIGMLAFAALFAINIQAIPFRYPPNRQLNQMETISKFVLEKTNNQPFNFALDAQGNSDHAYRYFFTIWGHPPVTIENYANDPQRKSVTKQLLVVCEQECHPLGDSLWEIAGFGRGEIVGEWQVSVVKVYKLVHYTGK